MAGWPPALPPLSSPLLLPSPLSSAARIRPSSSRSGRRCRAAQLSAVEEELEEGRAGGVGGREGEGARARVQGAADLTVGGFVPEVELRTEAWGCLDHEHRRHERWRGRGGRS